MDYFEIGKIVNTVGVRGELKIYPTTDDARRFDLLNDVNVVLESGQNVVFPIEKVRYHRNLVMLKLKGVDDKDKAEKLRGSTIVVARADALPLEADEYYIPDLVGLDVVAENGDVLGIIKDVLVTGANDVYIVKQPEGKDILIPAIKQCILNVDIAGGRIIVRLLEGLMP